MMCMQRITILEIKKHAWFLKNLPIELVEGGEEGYLQMRNADEYCTQGIDEALAILQEAQKPGENSKSSGPFLGGSMDLDDIPDVDTSGEFVCAL